MIQAFALSKKFIYLQLTTLLCLVSLPCFAQSNPYTPRQISIKDKFSRFQHYTMEQGLSNNWVTSVAQDKDGFLWFGTNEGLNRFDGERFTPFFQLPVGNGLQDDHITNVLALPGQRLLVGTIKGLSALQTRSLEFRPVELPFKPDPLGKDVTVYTLYLARNGQVWVGTNVGVYVLNDQLQVIQAYPTTTNSDNEFAFEFLELPDASVIVKFGRRSAPTYLPWAIIDFKQQKSIPMVQVYPDLADLDTALLPDCIASDPKHNIWLTTLNRLDAIGSLYEFNWETKMTKQLLANPYPKADKSKGYFNLPTLLPDSLLLLQRYFGAPFIYDLRDGTITDLPQWKTSWPDGKRITTFVDRNKNLWLCPRYEGVFFLTLKDLPATNMLELNAVHKQVLATMKVSEEWFAFSGIDYANQWVLSSRNGGLYSFDKKSRGLNGPIRTNPFQSYAYSSDFAQYRGDTLWMVTLGGLYWYSAAQNTHGPLKEQFKGLDSLDNKFLCRDHFGLIWGRVSRNGVGCFDTRTKQFSQFPSKGANAPFPMISASACAEGPDGDMWFSYGDEKKYVVRWRRKTGVFERIEPINPPGKISSNTQWIAVDRAGNLWMQNDQGLFVMDPETRKVDIFGKNKGLNTNYPESVCFDNKGNVWFATSNGLSRFDSHSGQLRTFYLTDGLLSNIISNVELLDSALNILLVSTDRGLCLFEPDKVEAATISVPTLITGLKVSDVSMSLPESGILALSYTQNDLRIEFTGINFINGADNHYQYSMEPENQRANWKEAGTDNFANFLNLSPGRYTFRARTANSDGLWGAEEARLSIVIHPPWWQTWTFQLLFLAVLAALGWAFYRRQIMRTENREKEKAQVRQQLADLEMKALRSQMNPHFVFNALNSVQNFILKNDTREASKYLTKFARLMRLILENSELPMVPLAREIELLRYYTELEQLRFNYRFAFDFQIDSSINPESISIPGMLIQPHIENAIWHGLMHKTEAGHLWIRFLKADEKTLVCEIEDDGIGRNQAAAIEKDRPKNHRSTGLTNIRHRLELLNAQLAEDIRLDFVDLFDENGKARGTKVVVRMPLVA